MDMDLVSIRDKEFFDSYLWRLEGLRMCTETISLQCSSDINSRNVSQIIDHSKSTLKNVSLYIPGHFSTEDTCELWTTLAECRKLESLAMCGRFYNFNISNLSKWISNFDHMKSMYLIIHTEH